MAKNLLLWVVIAIVLMSVFNNFTTTQSIPRNLNYSDFIEHVKQGGVKEVTIQGRLIDGVNASGQRFTTYSPGDNGLVGDLLNNNVIIKGAPPEKQSVLMQLLINWFPLLILIGIFWIIFMRQMQGGAGGRGAMSFGKSRARMLSEDQVKVTFQDVAGAEEAKDEVVEMVDFLRDPTKFQKLGGKIPKGVLMVGPPGTGKTLLARAIAGEAKVPFFNISGSDFVEMFVGVGASRVRDMFEQAKKHAPCIIFIDEIDAVGRHRGAGLGGGHDEREQTLNQLLVEMDGFEGNEGVIVIAATNRPDVLDPALLRPGRFDRQVVVPLPDVRGREQILKVHMRKIPAAENVKASILARGTPGFSGADLANLINEAALFAARANKKLVEMEDMEKAKDKIMMGAERRSMVMSEDDKRLTAYHESGHAIVGRLVPDHDPVHKVSIIPRGRALGRDPLPAGGRSLQLQQAASGEQYFQPLWRAAGRGTGLRSRERHHGGAERYSSGDRDRAQHGDQMGPSDKLGPLTYSEDQQEVFLGHSVTQHKSVSDETTHLIDEEIRHLIERNYERARSLLIEHMDRLHTMVEALMKYETIDAAQINDIMEGRTPRPPKDWEDEEPTHPAELHGGKSRDAAGAADDGPVGRPAGEH